MFRRISAVLPALCLLALPATTPAHAQQGAVELGIDAQMGYHIPDAGDNVFQFTLPFGATIIDAPRARQGFRVGYFVSDVVSIEPSVAINVISDGDETLTSLGLATALLYHFSDDASSTRPYASGGVNLTALDFGSGDDFSTQFGVFGELGVKVPIEGDLGARLGIGGARFFENSPDFQDVWSIFGTMGFSYFTG